MRIIAITLMALLLGGCAEFLAKLHTNAQEDYDLFRGAALGYIKETVNDRRWVREQCRMNLYMRTERLRAEEKWDELDNLYRNRYVPLLTIEQMKKWNNGDEEAGGMYGHLSTPWICGVGRDAEEDAPGAEPTG